MSNRTRLILIILVAVLAWALLELEPRQSGPGRTPAAVSASDRGAGVPRHRSSLSGASAMTTKSATDSKLRSQQAVVTGGAGAGKAPGSSVKPLSTPGVPQEVLEAAKTGLPFYLGRIPP